MTWLVVALVAIAVVALGAYLMDKQRSTALRRRFGPEYERAVGDAQGDRRAAERELRARLARRAELDLRALDPAERTVLVERWTVAQTAFVDDPAGALREARSLVEEVADARGYGGSGAGDRDELVALDHPDLVAATRGVHGVGDVDDLRVAFLHHRELFEAVLGGPIDDRDARAAESGGEVAQSPGPDEPMGQVESRGQTDDDASVPEPAGDERSAVRR